MGMSSGMQRLCKLNIVSYLEVFLHGRDGPHLTCNVARVALCPETMQLIGVLVAWLRNGISGKGGVRKEVGQAGRG